MSLFYKTIKHEYEGEVRVMKVANIVISSLVAFGLVVGVLMFALPAYSRYQKRQHAENQVVLNDIQIAQTKQLVEVQKQKAQIKVEEAKGIAEAQHIINQTLTPLYLQHEAIQAQEQMANSPNHTTIYIPSGSNGIPLIQTVNP